MKSCQVSIVEHDEVVRTQLHALLEAGGYRVQSYTHAEDFLHHYKSGELCFLVIDSSLGSMNGVDLFAVLRAAGEPIEAILITGMGSFHMAIEAFRAGFQDILEKPIQSDDLVDRVGKGTKKLLHSQNALNLRREIEENFAKLSDRERQVKKLLVLGKANKCIAFDLGISEKTVETHRARLMHKLGLSSVQELVRLSTVLQIDDMMLKHQLT